MAKKSIISLICEGGGGVRGAGRRAVVLFGVDAVDRWRVRRAAGRGGGARAARVALSPESRAPRNACIIIMTDADRAAAPLICGAFDLAAGAGPAPLPHKRAARSPTRSGGERWPFALALNRGFIL